ncbi:MAG: hypothetical protein ACK5NB_01945 [Flavobacteriaceae bacterium]
MNKCDKANHFCDKVQYREASLWEKIKLGLHLTYCKTCKTYTKSNINLSQAIKQSNIVCMDKNCKANLKKIFNKALNETVN